MYRFLRDIPNPYNHTAEIKDKKFFIGRKKELDSILNKIDDFISHGQKSDFIVTGDKSIGKSSFLNILKERLESKGLLVAHLTLTQSKANDKLLFFKELIDVIFDGGAKNDFLNLKSNPEELTQREIWEELTDSAEYEEFKNRTSLYFAKTYSSSLIKNDVNINISEVNLIKDFRFLVNSSRDYGFKGIIILIDEFQQLSENDGLIQIIQRLMDEIENLPFILAGNHLIKGESFEKIKRKSEPIELFPLRTTEIYDLIYKPLMSYGFRKEEINDEIDRPSFKYLIRKGEYNPYYVNMIMHNVFARYKRRETEKLVLDYEIIIEIINKLKLIAVHHERITSQLNASSVEQLEALYRLFKYQNINLNDVALLELAFNEFTDEEYIGVLSKIKEDIKKIVPLKLYKFNNEEAKEEFLKLENPTPNQAAEVKYCFDGDNIDELYMSQLVESRIRKDLPLKSHADVFEHFSERLASYLIDKLMKKANILNESDELRIQVSFDFLETAKEAEINSSVISNKIDTLKDIAQKTKISSEDYTEVQNSLSDTNLHQMPFIVNDDEQAWGYCYYFVKARIRYKIVKYEIIVPVRIEYLEEMVVYNQEIFDSTKLLSQYGIEILDSIVVPLQPRIVLFLKFIDLQDLDVIMMRKIFRGEFEEAKRVLNIMNRLQSEDSYDNNLGFLYMNTNDLNIAQKYFQNIKYKDLVTLCNLGYLNYLTGNLKVADQYLSEAYKKSKHSKSGARTLRVLNQILLPIESRKKLPPTFDIAIAPGEEVIILGNRAILASFSGQNHGIKLIKDASILGEFDKIYKIRYEYFLYHNLKQHELVLSKLDEFQNEISEVNLFEYFNTMLTEDKKILNVE